MADQQTLLEVRKSKRNTSHGTRIVDGWYAEHAVRKRVFSNQAGRNSHVGILIQAATVGYAYDGNRIFTEASIELPEGDREALIGESGAIPQEFPRPQA